MKGYVNGIMVFSMVYIPILSMADVSYQCISRFENQDTIQTVIDSIMRVWGHVRDLHSNAGQYTCYQYDVCIYAVIGMLLHTQALLQMQLVISDDERLYYLRILGFLEHECTQLQLSVLQARLIKECLSNMYVLLKQPGLAQSYYSGICSC